MTSSSVWQGEVVRLRAIEPGDWETVFLWNQDDGLARGIDRVWFPQSREATRRWAEEAALRKPEDDRFQLMIENSAGDVVGLIASHDCDRRVGTFAYGLSVMREHRRRGYARDAIRVLLGYFFRELGYQKVTVGVFSFNDASIRLHERLGFQREGTLRRTVYSMGKHWDTHYFGLTREEFEALPRPASSKRSMTKFQNEIE